MWNVRQCHACHACHAMFGSLRSFHSRARSWSVVDNTRSDAGFLQTLVDKGRAISVYKTQHILQLKLSCLDENRLQLAALLQKITPSKPLQRISESNLISTRAFLVAVFCSLSYVCLTTCLCSRLLCLNTLVPDNPVEVGLRAQTNDRKHRSECSCWLSNSGTLFK